ncbi:sigma-70 family RNA polymerase sigma factor [uncultured Dokdonia sp.]|uniref:RNA polymerase sigma factor n=1 Tax=uncultured Dokdonia sp. TaxID=575653 RepID=UPI00262600B1|nr:sigma-70 family RNA polymerase sigma factor [uncultured Dokdonia sp.]
MRGAIQSNHLYQEDLLQAIKANDVVVLKKLYTENFPKVAAFIQKNNGNKEQAKDIFQEAMVVLWKAVKTEKFKATNATAVQGYLYMIAKNKWTDHLRSASYKKEVSSDAVMNYAEMQETHGIDEDHYDQKLQKAKLAFAQLGTECKELLSKFYFSKNSFEELAQDLGLNIASVKNKKYRCMQRLRALVIPQKQEL